jgi:hypothetical protein
MPTPRLEFVSVCIGYAGELRETLPYNLRHADDYVVATAPDDEETREVCRRLGVRCLLSDDHKRAGADFNKGRLVQKLMDQVSAREWLCHVDADTALPLHFRRALFELNDLDARKVYGCDRITATGEAAWAKLKATGYLDGGQWSWHYGVQFPPGYPVGTRWVGAQHGYCPIGFLQLMHGEALSYKGVRARPYPAHHGDAARSDVQHAIAFDRKDRVLLPEVVAVHLESEPAGLGANWKGRTTRRFGPPAAGAAPGAAAGGPS